MGQPCPRRGDAFGLQMQPSKDAGPELRHNYCITSKLLSTKNVKIILPMVMRCWLVSKLVAVRCGGQTSSHDQSNTLKQRQNMHTHTRITAKQCFLWIKLCFRAASDYEQHASGFWFVPLLFGVLDWTTGKFKSKCIIVRVCETLIQ